MQFSRDGTVLDRAACRLDRGLASRMATFLLSEKARSVTDIGCGCGDYLRIQKGG